MFDKHAVEEYRSLTAPDDLRERVLGAADKPKHSSIRLLPLLGALAACFVLLFTANIWRGAQDKVTISCDWVLEPASTLSVPSAASARNNAAYYAAFTIESKGTVELNTEDSLFVCDKNGLLTATFPHKASDAVTVYWYVTSSEAHMTVNGTNYTLYADETDGTFHIVQD